MKKSAIAAFVLALLFGPLGLLYSTVVGGIILIVLALLLGSVGGPLAMLTWVVALIWAPVAAIGYNGRVDAQLKQAVEAAAAAALQVRGGAEVVTPSPGEEAGFAAAMAVVEPCGDKAVAELRRAHEAIKEPGQLLRIANQIAGDYA